MYAAINAVRLINGPMSYETAWQTVQNGLAALTAKGPLEVLVSEGLELPAMVFLFRQVIEPEFGLCMTRPFAKNARVNLETYWTYLVDFLAESRRAVILRVQCLEWDHWTVVRSITDRRLTLFDSGSRCHINRGRCWTWPPVNDRPIRLWPAQTFLLARDGDQPGNG